MKTIRYASSLMLALWCAGASVQAENTAAINEVLKLKTAGMSEDTIVSFIQGKNINYDLSADSLLKLRDQGVSPAVLNAMLTSGANAPGGPAQPPSTFPPPVPVAQPVPIGQPMPPAQPMPVAPAVLAQPPVGPDAAYFYQELSPYGRWMMAEDGQWCWQPTVVVGTPDWRPYFDKGHWVWTDQGWFWSSDYPWGWAAFHYGRWQLHPHHGWVWYPDRVWGPSWVAWRSGGDYAGWAPLPPGAIFDTTGGFFLYRGRRVEAGFDFGLGFAHFNFCFNREMGNPMSRHFREPEVRAIYGRTILVNNYSVSRISIGGEIHVSIFNHGLEPSHFEHARGHAFEQVRIQELHTPAPGRAHERFDAKGHTMEVYRPGFDNNNRGRDGGDSGNRGGGNSGGNSGRGGSDSGRGGGRNDNNSGRR